MDSQTKAQQESKSPLSDDVTQQYCDRPKEQTHSYLNPETILVTTLDWDQLPITEHQLSFQTHFFLNPETILVTTLDWDQLPILPFVSIVNSLIDSKYIIMANRYST